jgi:hypothetical protein
MGIDVTVLRVFTDPHRNFGNPLGWLMAVRSNLPTGRTSTTV